MSTENNIDSGNCSADGGDNGGGRGRKSAVTALVAAAVIIIASAAAIGGIKLAGQIFAPGAEVSMTEPSPTPTLPTADLAADTPTPVPTDMITTETPTPEPTSPFGDSTVVAFQDKEVEAWIRKQLDKAEGDITAGDMMGITEFKYDTVNDKTASGTIRKLDDLRYCINLQTLCVLHEPVTSLECLRGLPNLESVDILGCSVSDLSPLAGKESLTEAWISGNPVSDASPVLSLPNLQEFNAWYGTRITDISSLSSSGSLKYFYCPNTLKDYTPLLRQKNLEGVTLSGISDGFFRELLAGCTNLSSICLDHSDIQDKSLSLLKGHLFYNLNLEYCGLKDISALAGLAGVTDLRLDGNQIVDISALKGLNISYVVDLQNNRIKDLSPLEHMTTLQILNVAGNPYTDGKVLDKLAKAGCSVSR